LNKEVTVRFGKLKNAAVGFDVLTTCQPSTVWCSRERLPASAAQPAKVRQSCSATDFIAMAHIVILFHFISDDYNVLWHGFYSLKCVEMLAVTNCILL
jgi:hypothetical protein